MNWTSPHFSVGEYCSWYRFLAYGANVPGVTGYTTQQLRSGLPPGFDPKIWAEDGKINKGLPYLIANPPPD